MSGIPQFTLPEITATPNGVTPTIGNPYGSDTSTSPLGNAPGTSIAPLFPNDQNFSVGDVGAVGDPLGSQDFSSGAGPSGGSGTDTSSTANSPIGGGLTSAISALWQGLLGDIENLAERGLLFLLANVLIGIGYGFS